MSQIPTSAFSMTFKQITFEDLRDRLTKTVKRDPHLNKSVTHVTFQVYSTPFDDWLAYTWGHRAGDEQANKTMVEELGLTRLDDIVVQVKPQLSLVKGEG